MDGTVSSTAGAAARRQVRCLDVEASAAAAAVDGIEALYDDRLDVIVVRGALDATAMSEAGARLDRDDQDPGWARPNAKMPVEDIQLLGTDVPATPPPTSRRVARRSRRTWRAQRNTTNRSKPCSVRAST